MQSTRYLIVGGGMAGDAAAKGIREHDAEGHILVIGEEVHPPYARPPLSKKLWAGGDEESIWRKTADTGAELRLGRTVVAIDPDAHRATDSAGDEYEWEQLLLATGGEPRTIPGAGDVVYFRSLDDYRSLRSQAREGARFVVIGGGFIGSELTAALVGTGCHVTMVFPEPGISWRLLPASLSAFVTDYYRERGVEVLSEQTVASVAAGQVTTGDGRMLEADGIVAGLGIVPRTRLAEQAGLPVDDGIVVDAFARVEGRHDVFAAGDVANFPAAGLDKRRRVEHEDHAKTHGRIAGANMAGAEIPYDHLPFFYSDMFDLGYEAVGEVDARLETIERWSEPNRKGIVAYVDGERRPRGFLFWNEWDKVDAGRALIRAGEPLGRDGLGF